MDRIHGFVNRYPPGNPSNDETANSPADCLLSQNGQPRPSREEMISMCAARSFLSKRNAATAALLIVWVLHLPIPSAGCFNNTLQIGHVLLCDIIPDRLIRKSQDVTLFLNPVDDPVSVFQRIRI